MMENCCYGRRELMILNMVREGLLGEVLHAECGYLHDLRAIKFSKGGEGLWRRDHSRTRNGNLYPTHGLGPAQGVGGHVLGGPLRGAPGAGSQLTDCSRRTAPRQASSSVRGVMPLKCRASYCFQSAPFLTSLAMALRTLSNVAQS